MNSYYLKKVIKWGMVAVSLLVIFVMSVWVATGRIDILSWFSSEKAEVEEPAEVVGSWSNDPLYYLDISAYDEEGGIFVDLYSVDLTSGDTARHTDYGGLLSTAVVDGGIATAYVNDDQTINVALYDYGLDQYVDILTDRFEGVRNVALSDDNRYLAVGGRTGTGTEDIFNLNEWEVLIIDLTTNEVVAELQDAAQPQWSEDNNRLYFLKSDGVFVYSVSNAIAQRYISSPATLSADIDLSLDESGAQVVLTSPGGVEVIRYSFVEGILQDDWVLSETDRIYQSPLFSSDGSHVAFLAMEIEADRIDRVILEVRDAVDGALVYEKEMPITTVVTGGLQEWHSSLLPTVLE